ncbi:g427 [Coccomyxa elongata]
MLRLPNFIAANVAAELKTVNVEDGHVTCESSDSQARKDIMTTVGGDTIMQLVDLEYLLGVPMPARIKEEARSEEDCA